MFKDWQAVYSRETLNASVYRNKIIEQSPESKAIHSNNISKIIDLIAFELDHDY